MKTAAALFVLLACAGCAHHADSPYFAECAKEAQIHGSWWNVGTVQSELLAMCVDRKTAAAQGR